MTVQIISDPPTVLCTRTRAGLRIRWIDARNWCGELSQYLPRWLDLDAAAVDLDTARARAAREHVEDRIGACVQVLEAAWRIARSMGLVWLPTSAGSLAWHSYWRVPSEERLCPCGTPDTTRLERIAMGAPRVLPLSIGLVEGPVYWCDCRQQYTAIMHERLLPTAMLAYEDRSEWGELPGEYAVDQILAVCLVRDPGGWYPVYESGVVTWGRGVHRTVLAGPELALAAHHGHLHAVGSWIAYELGEPCLEWVERWRDVWDRAERYWTALQRQVVKSVGNALWGRCAAMACGLEPSHEVPPHPRYGIRYVHLPGRPRPVRVVDLWDLVLVEREPEPLAESAPAVAAWTQSWGRRQIIEWAEIAGWERVHYLAADALVVDEAGLEHLVMHECIEDDEPGILRVDSSAARMVIAGPGVYLWDDELVSSAVPSDARVPSSVELVRTIGPRLLQRIESGDPDRIALWHERVGMEILQDLVSRGELRRDLLPDVTATDYPSLDRWPPHRRYRH